MKVQSEDKGLIGTDVQLFLFEIAIVVASRPNETFYTCLTYY